MRMYDIILKKRNGGELSQEEIDFFIKGYLAGIIPDYQVSALLMAIFFQKMTKRETSDLTMAMASSGEVLDLAGIEGIKVDKHSTGGVGDKVSLVLGPLVAAAGVKVAKMSGRGLGHTGGTIDKLESIPGFSVELSKEQFTGNVNRIGLAIAGQTANLAPADKKLYALRDTTATVDNISLIAASIMSKKIASGADKILLDVKTGSGAFMKTVEDSFALAREMVDIGASVGRGTIAVISDMEQPLGFAVGNALEVKEAIATLQGKGPEDLYELCLTLGANMLVLAGKASTEEEAKRLLGRLVEQGTAFNKFKEFVAAQGGDVQAVDKPEEHLPKAAYVTEVKSPQAGYIAKIGAEEIGFATLVLGAGRETKESAVDLSVGLVLHKKVGDYAKHGDTLAAIHSNDLSRAKIAEEKVLKAIELASSAPEKRPLIFGTVSQPLVK